MTEHAGWLDARPTGAESLDAASIAAGIAGPVLFVGGWVASAALRPGYSSLHEAISQLARIGAPHRLLMTGAFVGFGVAMPFFARPCARALGGKRAMIAAITIAGLATFGVGCCPLSRSGGGVRDVVHGSFATIGYIAMVASASLGSDAFRRRSKPAPALASAAVAIVAAAALSATPFGRYSGLFQRLGLTVVDVWFVAVAVSLLMDRRRRSALGAVPAAQFLPPL